MVRTLVVVFLLVAARASAGWVVEDLTPIGYATGAADVHVQITNAGGGVGTIDISFTNPWAHLEEDVGISFTLRCTDDDTETPVSILTQQATYDETGNLGPCVVCAGDIDCDGVLDPEDIDMDGDGSANWTDDDQDGDGLNDEEDEDQDGDGIDNEQDLDLDGDGVNNCDDGDVDGDGDGNSEDDDDDGDGIPDDEDDSPRGAGDCDGPNEPEPPPEDEPDEPFNNPPLGCPGCVFGFPDNDGDGVRDDRDRDDDNDGIPDEDDNDDDGDGVPDASDPDWIEDTPGRPDDACAEGTTCDRGRTFEVGPGGDCGASPSGTLVRRFRDDDDNGVPDPWQRADAIADAKQYATSGDNGECCSVSGRDYDEGTAGDCCSTGSSSTDCDPHDEFEQNPSEETAEYCCELDRHDDYDEDGVENDCDADSSDCCFYFYWGLARNYEDRDKDSDGVVDWCDDPTGEGGCSKCACVWLERIHDLLKGDDGKMKDPELIGTVDVPVIAPPDFGEHALGVVNPSGGTAFATLDAHLGGLNNVAIIIDPQLASYYYGGWSDAFQLLDTMRLAFRTFVLAYLIWIFWNRCLALLWTLI